jgi:small-conductance mechanosensitive channel
VQLSLLLPQVFENAIFLFFTHPFDVGDTIRFEDSRYCVNSINLQYINLEHVMGADVNVPTSEMRAARLTNISRRAQLPR